MNIIIYKKIFFCFFFFIFFHLPLFCANINNLFIKGSFIQPYLVMNWDDKRWLEEFQYLREANIDFLIFMHSVHSSKEGKTTAIYPTALSEIESSKRDLLEICLRNAKKAGFKIFIGLNFDENWWSASFSSTWILQQMEFGNKIAKELIQRYKKKYPDTMYGWYWVWEVDNSYCKTSFSMDCLVQALNINLDYLHLSTPDMPFMLSPFMNSNSSTPKECSDMWKYILSNAHFKDGDIFAPQDCIGAGWLTIDVVAEWFDKLSEVIPLTPRIKFWANIEMFDQRFWTAATLDRIKHQMDLLRPYVSSFISFAYSHYYSPILRNPLIHCAYLHYIRTGRMPVCPLPIPVETLKLCEDIEGKLYIEWISAKEEKEVMGYHIYKDGVLIGDIQYDHNSECKKNWYTHGKGIYSVASYNVSGEESEKVVLSLE